MAGIRKHDETGFAQAIRLLMIQDRIAGDVTRLLHVRSGKSWMLVCREQPRPS